MLPLGIFLTYKAVNDSAVFNKDAYVNFFRKLFGKGETRNLTVKEVVIDEVDIATAKEKITALSKMCREFIDRYPGRESYVNYWLNGYDRREIHSINAMLEQTVDYMANSRNRVVILKLMELPVMRSLWFYHPTDYKAIGWAFIAIFPVGIPIYLWGTRCQRKLKEELEHIITTDNELIALLEVNTNDINT